MLNNTPYASVLEKSFAESYDNGTDLWSQDDGLDQVAKKLLITIENDKCENKEVLDIGTGNGRHAKLFIQNDYNYFGIDLYENKNWINLKDDLGKNVNFEQTFFQDWNSSLKFKGILDNGCFHHQSPNEYIDYLKKVYSLLCDQGYYVMSLYYSSNNGNSFHERMKSGKLRCFFNSNDVNQMLSDVGFSDVEINLVKGSTRGKTYLSVLAKK